MKIRQLLIGLCVILFCMTFIACEDFIKGAAEGLAEAACPTITTEYVHQQEVRNAVFTQCSGNSTTEEFLNLRLIVNGKTYVFTHSNDTLQYDRYSIKDVPVTSDIALKATVIDSNVFTLKLSSKAAPLVGGIEDNSCKSIFVNEQKVPNYPQTSYCRIVLEETLGASLTYGERYSTLELSSVNTDKVLEVKLYYED